VYLIPVDAPKAAAPAPDWVRVPRNPYVMAQVEERFEPHVLTVLQGARVEFPNRDDIYHNVFSLSSAKSFDLGRYPKGATKSVTFNKTGVVQVFCHIHSDMSAVVLVLANDLFATPGPDGRYAIENIPAGEYTVVGWHERTKPSVQRIRVAPGQTTTINFSLPLSPQALK
jgi:plastocyanin